MGNSLEIIMVRYTRAVGRFLSCLVQYLASDVSHNRLGTYLNNAERLHNTLAALAKRGDLFLTQIAIR